jgi:hypothetical protein
VNEVKKKKKERGRSYPDPHILKRRTRMVEPITQLKKKNQMNKTKTGKRKDRKKKERKSGERSKKNRPQKSESKSPDPLRSSEYSPGPPNLTSQLSRFPSSLSLARQALRALILKPLHGKWFNHHPYIHPSIHPPTGS